MSYSYNGKCYVTALGAGQAFCADHYPSLPTAGTGVSCTGATAYLTDGVVLALRNFNQGTAAHPTNNTTSQYLLFSQCSPTNVYLGTPGYGLNVVPISSAASMVVTGTVTAVGTVSASGTVSAIGSVTVQPKPFTSDDSVAYLKIFLALLVMLVLVFGARQVVNVLRSFRSEV
jgi:hypothetical protein